MSGMHPGRGVGSGGHISRRCHCSDHGFDLGPRDSAGAEQDRLRSYEREYGGFDADFARSAIEYEIDVGTQAAADVVGRGWRKLRKAVGAGGGKGHARSFDKSQRHGMRRHPQADGSQAGRNNRRNCRLLFEDKCQRAGPEPLREAIGKVGPVCNQRLRHFDGGYVHDQRAGRRAAFHRVDAGYGFGIERVGAQAVYGFGGEGYETSGAQEAGGGFDLGGIGNGMHWRVYCRRG